MHKCLFHDKSIHSQWNFSSKTTVQKNCLGNLCILTSIAINCKTPIVSILCVFVRSTRFNRLKIISLSKILPECFNPDKITRSSNDVTNLSFFFSFLVFQYTRDWKLSLIVNQVTNQITCALKSKFTFLKNSNKVQ